MTDQPKPFFRRKIYMKKRDLAFLPRFLVEVRAMQRLKKPEDLLSGVPECKNKFKMQFRFKKLHFDDFGEKNRFEFFLRPD